MIRAMASDRKAGKDVLSSLPSTRPQRRSARRGTQGAADRPKPPRKRAAATRAAKAPKPARAKSGAAKSGAARPTRPEPAQSLPSGLDEVVGTAVQAAGELAQIGLSLGTQALRGATKRLPRPR